VIELAAWSALLGAGDLLALADPFEEELHIAVLQRAIELDARRAEMYGVAVSNAIVNSRR
jgi:hypothetical protein